MFDYIAPDAAALIQAADEGVISIDTAMVGLTVLGYTYGDTVPAVLPHLLELFHNGNGTSLDLFIGVIAGAPTVLGIVHYPVAPAPAPAPVADVVAPAPVADVTPVIGAPVV